MKINFKLIILLLKNNYTLLLRSLCIIIHSVADAALNLFFSNSIRTITLVSVIAITAGCSSSNLPISKPPQDLKHPAINQARPSANKSTSKTPITPNKKNQEESAGEFKKFEEKRSNSGTVTEIKVNNRIDLPSYYLYPDQPQNQNLNINNQQRNISAPTWQLKW